jgi:UDP-N-acetylmuramoyl-L-alanyl-D-glutamate--2,6-diaminopimelate ligase
MHLNQLLQAAGIRRLDQLSNLSVDPVILGVQDDSRKVKPGDLFVARSGDKSDGLAFVSDAISRGAAAVVASASSGELTQSVPVVLVENPTQAVGQLAHAFFGRPANQLSLIGITGTSGKTTCAYLVRHLLNFAGKKCGMIGTVEIDDGSGKIQEADLTTPGAAELVQILARARDNQCEALVMETSSHSLAQERVSALRFAAAGFTNLSQDHLDYHKTMDDYAAAKAKLFEMLDEAAVAIVNGQDEYTFRMIQNCCASTKTFAVDVLADYRAMDVVVTSKGSNFLLCTPDGHEPVRMRHVGKHNVQNALLAAGIVIERFGVPLSVVAQGLSVAPVVPGRLQVVQVDGKTHDFAVLVDYAHKPDALEKVLRAMRPLTRDRLRVLFGCGGNRDRLKRPIMAQIAQSLADDVYITSDNPRDEDPVSIINEIMEGLIADITGSEEGAQPLAQPLAEVRVQPDRAKAIAQVIADAKSGDVVIIAGKGHENYQIVRGTKHHFDDVEECQKAMRKSTVRA